MVLRITRCDGADSGAILRLDGRLVAEGTSILDRHCAGLLRRPEGLNLDLVGISFVEWAGIEVLRRLARAGAELRCPSGPVASVLVGAGVRVVLDAGSPPHRGGLRGHRSSQPLFETTVRNHPSQPPQRH